jgi:hypothetical protein
MMMAYSLKDRKAGLINTAADKGNSMEYSLSKRAFKTETSTSETVSTMVTGYSLRERQWMTRESKACVNIVA